MLISRANLKILNDFKILDITPRSKNFGSYLHKFPSNLIWLKNFIFKIWIYHHPRTLVLSGTIFHLIHIYNCLDNKLFHSSNDLYTFVQIKMGNSSWSFYAIQYFCSGCSLITFIHKVMDAGFLNLDKEVTKKLIP